jgi:hypothetical protein
VWFNILSLLNIQTKTISYSNVSTVESNTSFIPVGFSSVSLRALFQHTQTYWLVINLCDVNRISKHKICYARACAVGTWACYERCGKLSAV